MLIPIKPFIYTHIDTFGVFNLSYLVAIYYLYYYYYYYYKFILHTKVTINKQQIGGAYGENHATIKID